MLTSTFLLTPITDQECTYMSCLLTNGRQRAVQSLASVLLTHCLCVPRCSYHAFGALGLLGSFRPYIWPRRSFPVKTIQIITSQICLYKLRAVDVESLIPVQRQYLRHRELLVAGDLVGEGVILGMLEAFVKELDAVAAGWDPELCRWFWQSCVSKPWRWLERRWDSKHSLIRRQELVFLKAVEAVKVEWDSIPSCRQLV